MCPIVPHAEESLKDVLCKLNDGVSPLAKVRWTHLARWSVVKPLPYKGTGKPVDPTWYLLFVSWFDGHTSSYIDALREGLGELNDRIWGHCDGYRGYRDPVLFRDFLLDHSMRPGLAFSGYQERVTEVRAALALRHRLTRPVMETSKLEVRDLEADLVERRRHG